MPIEVEKKYRLTKRQRAQVVVRLRELSATFVSEEFEENTLYKGNGIDRRTSVLRLRRVGDRAVLTFKKRLPSKSMIKQQVEDETEVGDSEACEAILKALGYRELLVYKKRRATWNIGEAELVLDQLDFGLFMEIEAAAEEIERVEALLNVKGLKAEKLTYPQLALRLRGKKPQRRRA
jgi:adenylate cyclase class 2